MYVCICNALSESKVRTTARNTGCNGSVSRFFQDMGAAPKCGKCVCRAVDILREEQASPVLPAAG